MALLARPGAARDRLSALLEEAGADCVIAADPTQMNPAELQEKRPQVVLVVLDPMTEEVLEQFDAVLGDPAVDVIYEEAEQAVAREGWDAARWQRHLVAKLQGHANVLPPGAEAAPAARDVAKAAAPAPVAAAAVTNAFDPVSAEFEDFDLSIELDEAPSAPELPAQLPAIELSLDIDSVEAADSDRQSPMAFAVPVHDPGAGLDFDFDFEAETAAADEAPASVANSAFDPFEDIGPLDPGAMELSQSATGEGEVESAPVLSREPLALQIEALAPGEPDTAETRESFSHDLESLQQRISTMALVDDTPPRGPEKPRGAVLVLSGLGGPDAVRQLLGALPAGFPRPLLVQQRLEGGRYDRLVTQLQRATKLPVRLAEPAQVAEAGTVYILPDAVGATSTDEGIRFSANPEEAVLAALVPSDSAVLLLSGSDPGQVDAVLAHSGNGALVAGQAADGCYDPASSDALAARGGDVAVPAELALRLCARWSTQGSSNVQD